MTEPDTGSAAPRGGDAITREPLHTRSIEMSGYRRSDGLFEIEGRLLDTKSADLRLPNDNVFVKAGEPLHQMGVRIVFDIDMTVIDVIPVTHAAPYAVCYDAPGTLRSLIGLQMTRGWSGEVKKRLSGSASCSHLAGLMVPMAAAAFQSMTPVRLRQAAEAGQQFSPQIGSCFAYAPHSDLVRRNYPTLYLAKADD